MKLFTREYAVAVAERTANDIYDLKKIVFRRINNNKKFWAADPFPIEINGELYIFAEIFEYKKNKGSIGYTKLENGIFSSWKIVIEENYHLSFPNLFYIDEVLYMCPEAYQSAEIYLYKCIEFPNKWIKDRVLVSGNNYVDTIFYKQGSSIYGFTSKREKNVPEFPEFKIFKINDNKCIFSNGEVKTLDIYLTRSAGKILKDPKSGENIMVSQIGKPLYGSGLIFKNFELEWPDYNEREIFRVFPEDIICDVPKKYIGIHTFNMTEHYIVIDLIWNRFSYFERFQSLKRKLKDICINKQIEQK